MVSKYVAGTPTIKACLSTLLPHQLLRSPAWPDHVNQRKDRGGNWRGKGVTEVCIADGKYYSLKGGKRAEKESERKIWTRKVVVSGPEGGFGIAGRKERTWGSILAPRGCVWEDGAGVHGGGRRCADRERGFQKICCGWWVFLEFPEMTVKT